MIYVKVVGCSTPEANREMAEYLAEEAKNVFSAYGKIAALTDTDGLSSYMIPMDINGHCFNITVLGPDAANNKIVAEACKQYLVGFPLVVDPKPNDAVNHPSHYQGKNGLEAIDVIEAFDLGYCAGNAVKYILRAGKKAGQPAAQDLRKAAWYLNHLAEQADAQS